MEKLTLLSEDQIVGDEKLEIFDKISPQATLTDLAILTGAKYADDDLSELDKRSGIYWTKTCDGDGAAKYITYSGEEGYTYVYNRGVGIRPVLSLTSLPMKLKIVETELNGKGIDVVELGNYPQKATSERMQLVLENKFNDEVLNMTGNAYTVYQYFQGQYYPDRMYEYEYNGKKYVKVFANFFNYYSHILSNREKYQNWSSIWVEVKPVRWILDRKSKLLLSEKILLAGVEFNVESNYKGDFESTYMYNFMDTYMTPELLKDNININILENSEIEFKSVSDRMAKLKSRVKKMKER